MAVGLRGDAIGRMNPRMLGVVSEGCVVCNRPDPDRCRCYVVTGLFDGIADHGAITVRGGVCRLHEGDGDWLSDAVYG